jgi:hypothetical protein
MRADGLIAAAIGLGLGSMAGAAPYTYLKLVDTTGPTSTLSAPSINGNGLVVVQAGLDLGGQQLLLGAAPPLAVAAATAPAGDGPFISFGAQPALNLPGVVAFQSVLPGSVQALYTDVGGPSTLVFDSTGVFEGFGQPAINMGGQVAFTATLDGPVAGVYRLVPGGPTTIIADTNGPYSGFMGDVSIAVDGKVLFRALLDGGGSGIRLGSGGDAEPIVGTGPEYSSFAAHAMSSNGVIAFQAGHPDGSQGVYLIADVDEEPTLIAHSAGDFSEFLAVAANNLPGIAFLATLTDGKAGIFTGCDSTADAVIKVGDPLEGSTVTGLSFSRGGYSDSGKIAFTAFLASGVRGCFVASPTGRKPPVKKPGIPGDLDGDGDVDGLDLANLLADWGKCPPAAPKGLPCVATPDACPGDLDDNGFVTGIDLAILLGNWTGTGGGG